jgi:hypothetical protein
MRWSWLLLLVSAFAPGIVWAQAATESEARAQCNAYMATQTTDGKCSAAAQSTCDCDTTRIPSPLGYYGDVIMKRRNTDTGAYYSAVDPFPFMAADPNNCGEKPPTGAQAVRGSSTACHEGCSYQQSGGAQVCVGASNEYCYASSWTPTGQTCSTGPGFDENHDPDKEVCTAAQGYTHCVQSSGRQCVTSSGGVRMCWDPGQTGPRAAADGEVGATRVEVPATPTPPPTMTDPAPAGPPQTTIINENTYVTQPYIGTGSAPGQGDAGPGGDGDGDGSADDGSDDEGDDAGTPGSIGGDLYTGSDDTIGTVTSAYLDRVGDAPIMDAAGAFFDVSVSGAACPTWSVAQSEWLPALTFDFFCDPGLQTMLDVAGLLILVVAAYAAFHIAIGN